MRVRMRLRVALLCAAGFAAFATPAHALDAWGDGIETISDDEMADLNGGFIVPGTSINVNLGAVVTTSVSGVPVLTSNITWTDAGQIINQTISNVGQNLADLSAEQRTALGLDGLNAAGGLVISDTAGVTALVHNITEGSLQNIIVNTASGREISQQIDVTLTLPGFESIQRALNEDLFAIRLSDDLRSVSFN